MLRGHGFPMPRELFICLQAAADEALGMGFDVFFGAQGWMMFRNIILDK